jgi:hypothetical protein
MNPRLLTSTLLFVAPLGSLIACFDDPVAPAGDTSDETGGDGDGDGDGETTSDDDGETTATATETDSARPKVATVLATKTSAKRGCTAHRRGSARPQTAAMESCSRSSFATMAMRWMGMVVMPIAA